MSQGAETDSFPKTYEVPEDDSTEEPIAPHYVYSNSLEEWINPYVWLEACRLAAKDMVPADLFEIIDPQIWTLLPWGHLCVVLRIPPEKRIGRPRCVQNSTLPVTGLTAVSSRIGTTLARV